MQRLNLILLFLMSFYLGAQTDEEYVGSEKIIDTNYYNGRMIIVFQDQSWEYADEYQLIEIIRTYRDSGVVRFDPEEVYTKNWRTTKTFSNSTNLGNLKDSIILENANVIRPVSAACNSGFKIRWGRWHKGNDFACPEGTPVRAAQKGRVRYAQFNQGGYGNLVIIRHENGIETYYAHLSLIMVAPNQNVNAGDVIGKVGNTGHSKGCHLHFETRFLDNPFDPQIFLSGEEILICSGLFPTTPTGKKNVSILELLEISAVGEEKEVKEVVGTRKRKGRQTSTSLR